MRALMEHLGGLRKGQGGSAMLMTLSFMALTIPLLMAALGLASTLATDALAKRNMLRAHYSSLAVGEYMDHLADDPIAWQNLIDSGGRGVVNINNRSIAFAVSPSTVPSGDHPDLGFQPLATTKTVTPSAVANNVQTTYTYTITVTNQGDAPEIVQAIYDGLPDGLTYVSGSTTGVTTADPTSEMVGDGGDPEDAPRTMLTWTLSPPVEVAPLAFITLTFQASGMLQTGVYCNEAWASPGERATGSGPAAKITVGSPSSTQCSAEAMQLVTTVDIAVSASGAATRYTYTTRMTNNSSSEYRIKRIQDLLPPGFTYVNGSTSGDITAFNPSTATVSGRQRLTWLFSSPPWELPPVLPGQTKTLTFQADAAVTRGSYWHEARVQFHQNSAYSWPSSHIRALDTYDVIATDSDGATVGSFQVWVGDDKRILNGWELHRRQ